MRRVHLPASTAGNSELRRQDKEEREEGGGSVCRRGEPTQKNLPTHDRICLHSTKHAYTGRNVPTQDETCLHSTKPHTQYETSYTGRNLLTQDETCLYKTKLTWYPLL